MKRNPCTELVEKYRAEFSDADKQSLSDAEMERVSGGVGGANEATCPVCGKPMSVSGGEHGDSFWICKTCNVNQLVSDAEFIEIIRMMEQMGYPGIEYPVWWKQVKKG